VPGMCMYAEVPVAHHPDSREAAAPAACRRPPAGREGERAAAGGLRSRRRVRPAGGGRRRAAPAGSACRQGGARVGMLVGGGAQGGGGIICIHALPARVAVVPLAAGLSSSAKHVAWLAVAVRAARGSGNTSRPGEGGGEVVAAGFGRRRIYFTPEQ
jgi:hypothetical protein